MITVVIPYFQRKAGVLRKALASLASQRNCPVPIRVIIVDDASPVPAAGEVSPLAGAPGIEWQVIGRVNGGPGAARNTGLSAVSAASRYVAFLDSDDEWPAEHLSRALQALAEGFDFFFGDHFQLGQTQGAFARAGRLRMEDHPLLQTCAVALHAYSGDMFNQILCGNVIGTSTVVFDFEKFRQLRFREEFTNAGEDYLFWMELAKAGARFCFSSAIEATYGAGVNVYSGSGWGTEQFSLRVQNEMKFRKTTKKLFDLTPEQDRHVAQSISRLRHAFAADTLHRVLHRKALSREVLRAQWALDPMSFLHLPVLVGRKLAGRS